MENILLTVNRKKVEDWRAECECDEERRGEEMGENCKIKRNRRGYWKGREVSENQEK